MPDKELQRKIRHLLSDKFCGCASDSGWEILRELLERAEGSGSFYNSLGDMPGRAVEFMGHVLDNWGLIEHWTSMSRCRLTDDGKTALAWLRERGTDTDVWPEYWYSCEEGEEW